MNEKKSILDLAEPISEATGLPKKLTDSFVRSLMDIIRESLQKDGIAKVKNLGTFKVIDIEERKSVNVQNGSEVVIPAHKKVSFTPDKVLKDEINKPYAHLETYVLKDDGPVDGPFIDEDSESDEQDDDVPSFIQVSPEIQVSQVEVDPQTDSFQSEDDPEVEWVDNEQLEEPVDEVVDTEVLPTEISEEIDEKELDDINTIIKDAEPIDMKSENVPENDTESDTESDAEKESLDQVETADETELVENCLIQEKDIEMENEYEKNVENESTVVMSAENQPEQNQPDQTEEQKSETPVEPTNPEGKSTEKGSNKWWLWLLIAVALILAALFGVRYYLDHKSANTEINTEPTLGQSTTDDIEVGESDPFFAEEGEGEEVAQNSENNVTPTDGTSQATVPSETQNAGESSKGESVVETAKTEDAKPVANAAEMKAFDDKLVSYMDKKHKGLNFPAKVAVLKEYTVKPGSRMTQISRNLYNETMEYWIYIYFFNTDVIKDPDYVKPGTVLKVPALGDEFVKPNSEMCKKLASEIRMALIK